MAQNNSRMEITNSFFKAPSKETDIETTVKRSRFIGSVRVALNAEEAQTKLKEIAVKYPKATHYCWAYRIGTNNILEHCSDAGEPAGTAGRPILGALKRCELDNTLIVVARYFGGIKLGVRGLIDAYGEAARLATEACEAKEMEFCIPLRLICGYDYSQTLLTMLDKYNFGDEYRNINYGETIEIRFEIPEIKIEEIKPVFEEMKARNFLTALEWGSEKTVRERRI